MNRRSIAFSGVFLVVVGSVFLAFGLWYVWTSGFSNGLTARDIMVPEFSGNLFWLISVSSSTIMLGIIFIWWAYRLRND